MTTTPPSIIYPETTAKLNQLLSFLTDQIKSGTEFTVEQAPLVAREIISFGFWSHLTYLLLTLVWTIPLLILGVYVLRRLSKIESCYDRAEKVVGTVALMVIVFFIICIALSFHLDDVLKTTFAPRLYILDYLRGPFP